MAEYKLINLIFTGPLKHEFVFNDIDSVFRFIKEERYIVEDVDLSQFGIDECTTNRDDELFFMRGNKIAFEEFRLMDLSEQETYLNQMLKDWFEVIVS